MIICNYPLWCTDIHIDSTHNLTSRQNCTHWPRIFFHAEKCLLSNMANKRSPGHTYCQDPLQINTHVKYFHVHLPTYYHTLSFLLLFSPLLFQTAVLIMKLHSSRHAWLWSESISRPNTCSVKHTPSIHFLPVLSSHPHLLTDTSLSPSKLGCQSCVLKPRLA